MASNFDSSRLLARSQSADNLSGFKVADDGWKNRNKDHVVAVTMKSRHTSFQKFTAAVVPAPGDKLYGLAIAKDVENLLCLAGRDAPLEDCPTGFFIPLTGVPAAFCSDNARANARARRILAPKHPRTVLLLCYAHQMSLACGEFVTKSKHASVLADDLFTVDYPRAHRSDWISCQRRCTSPTMRRHGLLFVE